MWQLKNVLAFYNDTLQSYETDNRGVLRYYIFFVFSCCLFYASLQLCNGGISFFSISDSVQIESNISIFCTSLSLRKKQVRKRCCFDSHLGTVRHCELLQEGSYSIYSEHSLSISQLSLNCLLGQYGSFGN